MFFSKDPTSDDEIKEIANSVVNKGGGPAKAEFELRYRNLSDLSIFSA